MPLLCYNGKNGALCSPTVNTVCDRVAHVFFRPAQFAWLEFIIMNPGKWAPFHADVECTFMVFMDEWKTCMVYLNDYFILSNMIFT